MPDEVVLDASVAVKIFVDGKDQNGHGHSQHPGRGSRPQSS